MASFISYEGFVLKRDNRTPLNENAWHCIDVHHMSPEKTRQIRRLLTHSPLDVDNIRSNQVRQQIQQLLERRSMSETDQNYTWRIAYAKERRRLTMLSAGFWRENATCYTDKVDVLLARDFHFANPPPIQRHPFQFGQPSRVEFPVRSLHQQPPIGRNGFEQTPRSYHTMGAQRPHFVSEFGRLQGDSTRRRREGDWPQHAEVGTGLSNDEVADERDFNNALAVSNGMDFAVPRTQWNNPPNPSVPSAAFQGPWNAPVLQPHNGVEGRNVGPLIYQVIENSQHRSSDMEREQRRSELRPHGRADRSHSVEARYGDRRRERPRAGRVREELRRVERRGCREIDRLREDLQRAERYGGSEADESDHSWR